MARFVACNELTIKDHSFGITFVMHYLSSPRIRRGLIALLVCLALVVGFGWVGAQKPQVAESATHAKSAPVDYATPQTKSEQRTGESPESSDRPPTASAANSATTAANPLGPTVPLAPAAKERDPSLEVSTRAQAAGSETIPDILKEVDMADPEARARVVAKMRLMAERQENAVLEKARQLGVPVRKEGPGHKVSVLYDFRGDEPLYRSTLNINAAISTGANVIAVAPYTLNGTGVKIGIWDGGPVRSTHQEFAGRVTKKDSAATGDDHATHVAGTIGATGVQPAAKGMAPKISIDSYEWTSDYAEMAAAGTSGAGDITGLPLSNHSYGLNAVTSDMGRYETEARSLDAVAASLPYYLPFWAAGNEQEELTAKGGYQSITFNGLAKNIMTIGAVNDAVASGVRSPAAGLIASFSSLGPCDDGRIKPDAVANGVDVYSSVATNNTAYDGTYSGTSMATPNAVGSSALLVQLYAREFSGQRMRASTLKALLIHTADDIGTTGPDYKYGWGLINVKAASDLILAHKASLIAPKLIEGTITNASKTNTHTFTWDGASPIRATVCWTDPAGTAQTGADSRTANLKHNLDAKITAPNDSTLYQPYVMPFVGSWTTAAMASAATTGKNNVDTVEQVYVAAPSQAGTYTVTVSLDGTLTTANQTYSLIITGGTNVESNPPPTIALTSPSSGGVFMPNAPVTLAATATDLALGGGPGAVSKVEFFNGSTSLGVDTTAPYSLNWTPPSSGTYTITAQATDDESATATSSAATITVLTGDGVPVISSFTPGSGAAGSLVILTGYNFVNVSSVRFNGVDATFLVDSAGQITATVPASATSGAISVVTPYGSGTSTSLFTVLQSPVLISQIFGGGGNTGAIYNRDYVELYNRSESSVSLTGWSVQYASSSGSTWNVCALSGSIAPGKYCLVGLGTGSSGVALPTVDVSGTIGISATAGKIALVNSSTALTGSSPIGTSGLQDFVGYGIANAYEGSVAPAPSASTAIFRLGGGATDTGNNAADFAATTPNPRNSISGAPLAPTITSATIATGTVGSAFSYQIVASNAPTSYAATGLPSGLAVNATTGVISGTPTTAGSTSATISATNSAGTNTAVLSITISPASGIGATLLSEDFSSLTAGNSTSSTGPSSTEWSANGNFTASAKAYSAGGAVKLGNKTATGSITSKILNLSGSGGNFTVNFKVKGWKTVEGNLTITATGLATQTVAYTSNMSYPFETKTLNFSGGTANSTITFATTAGRAFLDDVVVTSTTSSSTPLITTSGTLGSVSTTYGTASPTATRFSVSGGNLTAGILVTPPPGFEVSQTSSTTNYAATQTIAGSGTIAATPIYLRLAAGTTAGSYSGIVTCSSAGAVSVDLQAATSDVRLKLLTITANNQVKPLGTLLSLSAGNSTFTSSGLVGNETIGSVTLTASGGTAVEAPAGIYSITPSAAIGGTFDANNYDLYYVDGTLTVTDASFATWISGYQGLSDSTPSGDPDVDGLSNLVEYFMGHSPAVADSVPRVSHQSNDGSCSFIYRKAKGVSGVSGVVEWTTDLAAWSTSGITESSVDFGTYEEITATIGKAPGETRKFMHLKVSQR